MAAAQMHPPPPYRQPSWGAPETAAAMAGMFVQNPAQPPAPSLGRPKNQTPTSSGVQWMASAHRSGY